ncbi:MAG: signal peptide peptidase SppA [Pseudomonadota bacterium]
MAKKRHTILTVLVILLVVALILGGSMILFLKLFGASSGLTFNEKIGVIPIDGTITSAQDITSQLVKFKKDEGIRAIILRINSPGGAVAPAQEIYREVEKTVPVKRVIASMGTVAASGGYYAAAAADRIVASPGTITGSIGVILQFIQLEGLLEKIGVQFEILKSGEFKDIGSPDRKLTERDREVLNALIQDIQEQFVKGVAKGRNLAVEKVRKIADGRVFTGAQAKELGLVDVLGNFQDAVELAKESAGIKGDVTLVYSKKSKLELLDLLLESASRSVLKLLQGTKTTIEYRWSGPSSGRSVLGAHRGVGPSGPGTGGLPGQGIRESY